MVRQEQKETWQEVKEIWGNSSQGEKINFQVSKLINELKGKISQFEKDSIESDMVKVRDSWSKYKDSVSQFEKDSISKDLLQINKLLKKLLQKLRIKK